MRLKTSTHPHSQTFCMQPVFSLEALSPVFWNYTMCQIGLFPFTIHQPGTLWSPILERFLISLTDFCPLFSLSFYIDCLDVRNFYSISGVVNQPPPLILLLSNNSFLSWFLEHLFYSIDRILAHFSEDIHFLCESLFCLQHQYFVSCDAGLASVLPSCCEFPAYIPRSLAVHSYLTEGIGIFVVLGQLCILVAAALTQNYM